MGAFLAEYKKEAEARIRETMQAEGVICSQAEVEIEKDEKSGEYGKIRKIILHLKEEKMTSPQDEETKMVKEKAGEEVSVKVEIPPVITKEKQERPGTESKQEQQLKRKVAQYYGLEEACIEIWWEDDQGEMAVSASVRSDPDDPVYAIPGSSSKKTGQTKGENVSLWEKNSSGDGQQTEENIVQEPVQAASAKPAQDYEKELEDRISQLLKSVEGVGKVDVMVVLSSSGEKVFRTDRSENTSTTKEKDASGGERDAVSSQLEENTVFPSLQAEYRKRTFDRKRTVSADLRYRDQCPGR